MRPAPAQFATGELCHLCTLQGFAYTAGGQVGKDWEAEGSLHNLWEGFLLSFFFLEQLKTLVNA